MSPTQLHWLGLHLPLLGLVLLESLLCWRQGVSRWGHLWPVYNTTRWFLYGYVANDLIKGVGKQTIGRLRPHFLDVCRPVFPDGGSCSDEAHQAIPSYHEDYSCRPDLSGATEEVLRDVHVSFPSGHSAMAFYGLVFVALHLRRRRWPLAGSLLGPALQLLCVALAWFVALSRVMDYKHHWSDVAAGSLLGAGAAFAVVQAAASEERRRSLDTTGEEQEVAVEAATAKESQQMARDLCLVTSQSHS